MQRFYNATFHLALVSKDDWDVHYQWLTAGTGVLLSYGNELRLAGMNVDWTVYWDLLEHARKIAETSSADSNVSLSVYKEALGHCKKVCMAIPACCSACCSASWSTPSPRVLP